MFNKDKNTQADKAFLSSATLISAGTVVQGELRSENDLRIDGTIHGNIFCQAKVVVGPSGIVDGNIESIQADVSGKLTGNILARELVQLRNQGQVHGNISAASLQIEAGALFIGQSLMGQATNVVHMNEGDVMHAKAE